MYMNFVSGDTLKRNIIVLKKKKKRKRKLQRKVSKRYVLLPPRMLNLPKSNYPPKMIHYHYLSGFGRQANLNEAPQPTFHENNFRPPSPDVNIENIFPYPDDSFEFSNPLNKENYFTPSTKIEDDDF